MKKILCLLMVLLLLPCMAMAAVRMPQQRGWVTDDADVLSAEAAADIASYAQTVSDETGIRVYTVIVHFLDGMDAQSYANELFALWGLGENDMLLLTAAGEDSVATAMGGRVEERLGRANADNLMYTSSSFASLIRTQQYDAAFASYYPALNTLMEKQLDEQISISGLFGAPAQQMLPTAFHSSLWGDVVNDLDDSNILYHDRQLAKDEEEDGLTLRGWIVLIVLFILFSRGKKRRVRHAAHGCGCSPLSWIFRVLGISFVLDKVFDLFDRR